MALLGRHGQGGNVFTVIFAAAILIGVLGSQVKDLINGPISTAHKVTQINIAENDLIMNTNLIGQAIRQQSNGGDIDNDRYFEPIPYADCPEGPTGGGCLPQSLGAVRTDPWGMPYGYCAWDHGDTTGSERRLNGTTTTAGPVIALISAGPNRRFETFCHGYDEAGVDPENIDTLISPAADGGGDDRVRMFSYEAAAASSYIGQLPDEACTEHTAGLMRYDMETLQICNGEDWTEVSGDAFTASGTFTPVYDADLSTQYTSNSIVFEGFLGERAATVTGGATIIVNGIAKGPSTTITDGDSVSLRAWSASSPETVSNFVLSVSAVNRQWSITTRDRTPPNLTITPETKGNMNVAGPGNPAYGSAAVFMVRNAGETPTAPLSGALLSNTENFEFYGDGDACQGEVLNTDDVCILEIRSKASGSGSFSGTLSTSANGPIAVATISGNATGWSCTLPWGGTLSDGQTVTAYQTASVPFGNNCVSETRTCSSGTLSGSYSNENCVGAAPSNCTLPWGGTISHGSSRPAYQTTSVPYGSTCASQTRTCNNGSLSGSYTKASCSVAAPASCALPWGGTIAHGQSRTAYAASSVGCNSSCASQTRTCNNGSLSGSYTKASCTAQTCGYYWISSRTNGLSSLPWCSPKYDPASALGSSHPCTGVTANYASGGVTVFGVDQAPTCRGYATSDDGNTLRGYFCNANPKILCAYFNSIGLLPDHIYAADLRYAQQFVPASVNRGYRLWAEPITAYLERNPDSILIPLLRPLVVGWAEEMAYRVGEADKGNWIGRVLITVGTPVSKAIAWVADIVADDKVECGANGRDLNGLSCDQSH